MINVERMATGAVRRWILQRPAIPERERESISECRLVQGEPVRMRNSAYA